MPRPPVHPDVIARMRAMRRAGHTFRAIADELGLALPTVKRYAPAAVAEFASSTIDDEIEYWPRITPPPPAVPAAEALDYRLSPRERALRQHGRVK